MKRYLANIIERTKADHKIIAQLRNEVTGKEKIISEMDQLITEISMQLASYKNELQKVELEGGATRSKPSKSMRESMITNATTTAAGIESRLNSNALALLSHGASPNGMKSEDELSLSQVAEEAPKIRRKLDWDIEDSDEIIRKLRHEASERERLIEHYQSEIMRLSYETHRKSRGKYDPLLTEIEEVE
jgi:chromosome segregation ATPase